MANKKTQKKRERVERKKLQEMMEKKIKMEESGDNSYKKATDQRGDKIPC